MHVYQYSTVSQNDSVTMFNQLYDAGANPKHRVFLGTHYLTTTNKVVAEEFGLSQVKRSRASYRAHFGGKLHFHYRGRSKEILTVKEWETRTNIYSVRTIDGGIHTAHETQIQGYAAPERKCVRQGC